jgi:N-acetyl-anhydromuramoyl-L-alanine amidase
MAKLESGQHWQAGWLSSAEKVESPNFGPRPAGTAIDLIVVHSISLPPGVYGGDHVQQLFTNQLNWDEHPYFQSIRGMAVSSHFYIQRSGKLVQFVSCDERAWHAGASHFSGRANCNDFSVGIELEGLEGETFDAEQYRELTKLCHALREHYPIEHVAGHEHIASGRKFDPGAGFNWRQLQKSLGWPSRSFPQPPVSRSDRASR